MTEDIVDEGKPTTLADYQRDGDGARGDTISANRTETDIVGESPATRDTMEMQKISKTIQGNEDHCVKAAVHSEAKRSGGFASVESAVNPSVEEFMSDEAQIDGESSDDDSETVKKKNTVSEVRLGPVLFTSSVDMFNFFYNLLDEWPLNLNLNKYEHQMLEELVRKGHPFAERIIGEGIKAFQIRVNNLFYRRSYYIVHDNGSLEEFSYRNCIDNVFPLPRIYSALSRKKFQLGRQTKRYGQVRL